MVIGVLAVIAILAAMLVPSITKRVDFAAWSSENASLSAMKDALVLYVLRSNTIPNQTSWITNISSQLGLAPVNISTNRRNFSRAFLIDNSGWLGNVTLPYTVPPGGVTTTPSSARLMIVSTIAKGPLPVASGAPGTASFNDIWNTPEGRKPTNSIWTSWAGTNGDLIIQRINLEPLFHRVILVNGANNVSSGSGYFSINNNNLAQVPPGASGTNTYYLDGTVLNLSYTSATNQVQAVIHDDLSRIFEYGVWQNQINVGMTNSPPSSYGIGWLAVTFCNAGWSPNANAQTPQATLGVMNSYMGGYTAWANTGFNSPAPSGGVNWWTQFLTAIANFLLNLAGAGFGSQQFGPASETQAASNSPRLVK
jgi:type II secretory pathway pseudopilin PulG